METGLAFVVQPGSDGKRRHDDRERFPNIGQALSSTGSRERQS
jgi:hypothetical protein